MSTRGNALSEKTYLKIQVQRPVMYTLCVVLVLSLVLNAFVIGRKIYWALLESSNNGSFALDRESQFSELARSTKVDVVLVGDSHINRGEWSELLPVVSVANRGIAGASVEDVRQRLQHIVGLEPRCIIFMVGYNDLARGSGPETFAKGLRRLLDSANRSFPNIPIAFTKIWSFPEISSNAATRQTIAAGNLELEKMKKESNFFLDEQTFSVLNENPARYSNDGIHLNGPGYLAWSQAIRSYLSEMRCVSAGQPSAE